MANKNSDKMEMNINLILVKILEWQEVNKDIKNDLLKYNFKELIKFLRIEEVFGYINKIFLWL